MSSLGAHGPNAVYSFNPMTEERNASYFCEPIYSIQVTLLDRYPKPTDNKALLVYPPMDLY